MSRPHRSSSPHLTFRNDLREAQWRCDRSMWRWAMRHPEHFWTARVSGVKPRSMSASVAPPAASLPSVFEEFTLPHAVSTVGQVVSLPSAAKRTRGALLAYVQGLPQEKQGAVLQRFLTSTGTKRRRVAEPNAANKRSRVASPEVDVDAELLEGPFLQVPTEEVLQDTIIRCQCKSISHYLAERRRDRKSVV